MSRVPRPPLPGEPPTRLADFASVDDPLWEADDSVRVGLGPSKRELISEILNFGDYDSVITHGDAADAIRAGLAPLVPLLTVLLYQSKLHEELPKFMEAGWGNGLPLWIVRKIGIKHRHVPGLGPWAKKPGPIFFPLERFIARSIYGGGRSFIGRPSWTWGKILRRPFRARRHFWVLANYFVWHRTWAHKLKFRLIDAALQEFGLDVKSQILKRTLDEFGFGTTSWASSFKIARAIYRMQVAECFAHLNLPLRQDNPRVPDQSLGKRRVPRDS